MNFVFCQKQIFPRREYISPKTEVITCIISISMSLAWVTLLSPSLCV